MKRFVEYLREYYDRVKKKAGSWRNFSGAEWALIGVAVTIICTILGTIITLTVHPFYPPDPIVTPTPTLVPQAIVTSTPLPQTVPKISITRVEYNHIWETPPMLPYSKNYWDISDEGAITTTAGNTFTYDITFTSTAWTLSHSVESISIGTKGFKLEKIDPPIPSEKVTSGSSLTEKLTIRAPDSEYAGPLKIEVTSH